MLSNLAKQIIKKYDSLLTDFTDLGKAMFWAQCHHETMGFTKLEEDLNYTTIKQLIKVFGSRVSDNPERYIKNPIALANKVYANRMGNTEPNDGYLYRGRGLIHLTGREDYTKCGKAIKLDLVHSPSLLANIEKEACVLSAIWVFKIKKLVNNLDCTYVTKRINGSDRTVPERQELFNQYSRL